MKSTRVTVGSVVSKIAPFSPDMLRKCRRVLPNTSPSWPNVKFLLAIMLVLVAWLHVMSLLTLSVEIVPTPATVIVVASRPPFAYRVPTPSMPTVRSPK